MTGVAGQPGACGWEAGHGAVLWCAGTARGEVRWGVPCWGELCWAAAREEVRGSAEGHPLVVPGPVRAMPLRRTPRLLLLQLQAPALVPWGGAPLAPRREGLTTVARPEEL